MDKGTLATAGVPSWEFWKNFANLDLDDPRELVEHFYCI